MRQVCESAGIFDDVVDAEWPPYEVQQCDHTQHRGVKFAFIRMFNPCNSGVVDIRIEAVGLGEVPIGGDLYRTPHADHLE